MKEYITLSIKLNIWTIVDQCILYVNIQCHFFFVIIRLFQFLTQIEGVMESIGVDS
jgi:hypothetical protein